MKKYRIREGSPAAYIRDISIGCLMGVVLLLLYLMGLRLECIAMGV